MPASGTDKVLHFIAYAVLAALLCRALSGSGVTAARTLLWAFVLATLYGVSDEVHQSHVPGREADVMDLLADALGAAGGALAWYAKGRPGPGEER
jgi:VanZ family protein